MASFQYFKASPRPRMAFTAEWVDALCVQVEQQISSRWASPVCVQTDRVTEWQQDPAYVCVVEPEPEPPVVAPTVIALNPVVTQGPHGGWVQWIVESSTNEGVDVTIRVSGDRGMGTEDLVVSIPNGWTVGSRTVSYTNEVTSGEYAVNMDIQPSATNGYIVGYPGSKPAYVPVPGQGDGPPPMDQ